MVFLRALFSTLRMIRYTAMLAHGLTPDEGVLLDAPDERLGPALAAAGRGDHRPAAALLATTREAAEWESRDRYTTRLAIFAQYRADWFADWLAAAPRDPDAALVKAELAVRTAWEQPWRDEPPHHVVPLLHTAAEAAPGDPVPWRIAIDHARTRRTSRARFDSLWEQAVRRSPHHYGCHVAALQFMGADCRASRGAASRPPRCPGVHPEALHFAEQAAKQALPGSLLHALPLRAAFTALRCGAGGAEAVSGDRVDAAVELAISLSARYEPGDPWPAEVRNLLAYVLTLRGRWAEALEQFRLIGPHATTFPWDRISDDPLGQFLELRDGVRIQLASTIPLRRRRSGRPGGTPAPGG